jgi:D-amino-acid dehydrogenase
VLAREAIAGKDPALGEVREKFAGALYASNDESGDCRLFARNMAKWLEDRGVIFKFGTTVTDFELDGDRIEAVVTDTGRETGDAVVLALGVYSPHLARKLGAKLPIYPVKGYSITAPVAGKNNPPGIGGIDEENLIAYAPYGDRVRATATAEFSGYERTHRPEDFRAMLSVMRELFPNGANWEDSEYWAGLRPMTPEGTPILGQSRYRNLWFNTGQGHMGWTMSHGAARITADLVAGKKPQISLEGMTDAA